MTMIFQKVIFIFVIAISSSVVAVEPDEVLDNPSLEERARQISKDLRCLVCQNESIDESDAALARDLRVLVRERLQVGDSNEEVLQFVVDRYGEFALLRPRIDGVNYVLWWFGPLFLIFSIAILTNESGVHVCSILDILTRKFSKSFIPRSV